MNVQIELPHVPDEFQMHLLGKIKNSDWLGAFMFLQRSSPRFEQFTLPLDPVNDKWTILQHACNIDDEETATNCVQNIFKRFKLFPYTIKDLDKFVNHVGHDGRTALHIAISRKHSQVVEDLLLNAADITLPEKFDDKKKRWVSYLCGELVQDNTPLAAIYENFHRAMIRLFDNSFEVIKGKYDPSNENFWSVKCNFKSVTGVKSEHDSENDNSWLRETRLLVRVLGQSESKRQEILAHPLIQIFLFLKRKPLQNFIYASVLYHIIWSLLSIVFIIHHTGIHRTEENGINGNCENNTGVYIFETIPILYFYPLVALFFTMSLVKETVEFCSSPHKLYYLRQKENIGQWVVIIIVLVATIEPLVSTNDPYSAPRIGTGLSLLYIGGITSALLLIQAQSTKFEKLGEYNHMFSRILERLRYIFLVFSPMILAFMFIFNLLLPKSPKFDMNWGYGLVKITTMMAELTYDEILHSDDNCLPYPVATNLVIFLFTITVGIILSNLLIGLTVADIKLIEDSKFYHLAAMLEVIYLIEHFLTSRPVLWFHRNVLNNKTYPFNFMVGPAKYTLIELALTDGLMRTINEPMMLKWFPKEIRVVIKNYKREEVYTHSPNEEKKPVKIFKPN